jgi:hypothetical protein
MYGDYFKTAARVPRGTFMRVLKSMVNVVGNDLKRAQIIFKTGMVTFSGAVNSNMELKS